MKELTPIDSQENQGFFKRIVLGETLPAWTKRIRENTKWKRGIWITELYRPLAGWDNWVANTGSPLFEMERWHRTQKPRRWNSEPWTIIFSREGTEPTLRTSKHLPSFGTTMEQGLLCPPMYLPLPPFRGGVSTVFVLCLSHRCMLGKGWVGWQMTSL